MSVWTRALSTALVDFIWQGALVGLLLWAALAVLRGRTATVRYAVSCVALLVLAALPVVTTITLLSWADVSIAAPEAEAPLRAPAPVAQTMLPIWRVADEPRMLWLERVQIWALPVWSLGVLVFSARLIHSYVHAQRLRRRNAQTDESTLAVVHALAARMGITRAVGVVVSSMHEGPSALGWLRPTLLLPPATAMGLTREQLEAVIAHELAHIKRRDYLVNIFQVIVETVLFYHPVVWWTSAQIRAERELCCDDEAVRACGNPVSYARALTTLARQQLASPALAMGASGGALLHRVRRLVGVHGQELGPSRVHSAMALSIAAACVVLNLDWLQAFADVQVADGPRFEVVSVKRNVRNDGQIVSTFRGGTYTASGFTVAELIRTAYGVQEFQVVGGPSWISDDRYDVVAKEPEGLAPETPGTVPTRRQLMLRSLLADRFSLAVHKETREMPVFAILLAHADGRLGPNLQPSTTDCSPEAQRARAGTAAGGFNPWQRHACGASVGPGLILAGGKTMAEIATDFSKLTNTGSSLNRLVVDRTGLDGRYDLELRFTPERIPSFGPGGPPPGMPTIDPNGPSIFTAVREQLGLKLESRRGPVEVLVIDRVEPPTDN